MLPILTLSLLLSFTERSQAQSIPDQFKYCELSLSSDEQFAFALTPKDLSQSRSIGDWWEDFKILFKSRFGRPSFQNERFSITVVGSFSQHQASPQLVTNAARILITDFYAELDRLNLKPLGFYNFVIALNKNEFSTVDGKDCLPSCPFFADFGSSVRIRGFGPLKRMVNQLKTEAEHHIIVPADVFGGPLLNRTTFAHELSHGVLRTHNALLNEALADFLAELLTNDTKAVEIVFNDRFGLIKSTPGNALHTLRDTSQPIVKSIESIVPDLGSYHINSTVLSGLFHDIHVRFGRKDSANLLNFILDHRSQVPTVLSMAELQDYLNRRSVQSGHFKLTPKQKAKAERQQAHDESTPRGPLAVLKDTDDANVKTFIANSVITIASIVKLWADGQGYNIDDMLATRGLVSSGASTSDTPPPAVEQRLRPER